MNAYLPTATPTPHPLQGIDPRLLAVFVEIAVMRVSARRLANLANVEENGRRLLQHVPSVKYLDTLPEDILEPTPAGEALRRQYGFVTLLRKHASPHADQPNAVMGYAVPAPPHGVVIFVHDSAADANVSVPGDPIPRVAFAELLIAVFQAYPSLRHCHFPEWARWVRDDGPEQRIKQASQLFNVTLWNGERPVDLLSVGGAVIAKIEGEQTTNERRTIRKRTTLGTLNALTAGKTKAHAAWPYAFCLLPIGYTLPRDSSGDFLTVGEGKTKWRPIEIASPAEVEALRQLLRRVASGATWLECGQPLALAKVRCLGQRHRRLTYDQLTDQQLGAAARSIVNDRNLQLWETGWYDRDKDVPIPTDGDLDGYRVVPRHGSYGVVPVHSFFGLPTDGFLDADTARQIRQRLARRGTKDGDQSKNVAPFAYLSPYRDTHGLQFSWERRLVRNVDGYEVRQRPAAETLDRNGSPRGWRTKEGEIILTVRRADLESSIGRTLAEGLQAVAARLAPLQLRERRPDDPRRRLTNRIDELTGERDNHQVQAESLDGLAIIANTPGTNYDPTAAARHSKNASAAFARVEALEAHLGRLRAELSDLGADTHDAGHGDLDLRRPASLAGMLQGYAGATVPIEVNQALRTIGLDTLRLDLDPDNSRRVHWRVTLTLPLLDGTQTTLPLAGVVRNRRRDQNAQRTEQQVAEALARDFLHDAVDLTELSQRYGIPRARAVDLLRSWLNAKQVKRRGLRGAIVDLPAEMTETRRALWGVLGGDPASRERLQPLHRLLEATYRGALNHPNAWVRRDCALARRVLAVLVDALPGSGVNGVDIGDLAKAVGATVTELNLLCGDESNTGATDGRYAGILVRSSSNRRIVRMRPCPHHDCDAAPGHRWLSHYLPVPETAEHHGLLCPSCRRLPDPNLADLRLPASYFDTAWDGPEQAANFDLGSGPATVAGDPEHYKPGSRLPRTGRLYNIYEAAETLEVPDHMLRAWCDDPEDPVPHTRINGARGGKRMFSRATLETLRDSDRVRAYHASAPRGARRKTSGLITLRQIAEATGVAEHFLRRRIADGLLQPACHVPTGTGAAPTMLFDPDVLRAGPRADGAPDPLPQEWIARHQHCLLSIGNAARRLGIDPAEIRSALASGELACLRTDGNTRLIHPDVLAAWDAARGQGGPRLTPQAAADSVGIGYERLRAAARAGALPSHTTPGGHRRFTAADLAAWKAAGFPIQPPTDPSPPRRPD